MAHYHELSVDEAELILADFYKAHEHHEGFEVKLGGFALFLSCPECEIADTVIVDNPEYHDAAGALAAQRLSLF